MIRLKMRFSIGFLMMALCTGQAATNDVIMGRMTPAEFKARLTAFPIAYIPIGQLEWHNEHLPLGTDGVKAQELCVRAAQQYGGIVIPADFFGMTSAVQWDPAYGFTNTTPADEIGLTAGPGCFTVQFSLITNMFVDQVLNLDKMGFKAAIFFTGHYPPEQVGTLAWLAWPGDPNGATENERTCNLPTPHNMKLRIMTDRDLAESLGAAGGDHAGKWETTVMMGLMPAEVRMDVLPASGSLYNVSGIDPRGTASVPLGQSVVAEMVRQIGTNAQALVSN